MKGSIIIAGFILVFASAGSCQLRQQPNGNNANNVEVLKEAYITRGLTLTVEESQKFWPVYNSYIADLKKARQENKAGVVISDEAILNVRKKYIDSFKRILGTDERVNSFYQLERGFGSMMRGELQKRMKRPGQK